MKHTRRFFSLFLALALLTACRTGAHPSASTPTAAPSPTPTAEPVPTPTPPPAATPTPTPIPATPTPEPSPSPEPSQEPESSPETTPEPTQAPFYPRGKDKLYVLMLHDVVEDGTPYSDWSVSVSELREYLQWLSDHGYTTVLPSQLVAQEPLPDRAVLLTFDDGYASNYTLAYPLLQEFQAKAVVSLLVRAVELQSPSFLSWDMCREMQDSGLVEFGSHTYDSHEQDACLRRLKDETQKEYEARIFPDLEQSIQLIEEQLGSTVSFFAYPNGQTDKWSDEFLSQHFDITVTTTYGSARLSKGLFKLPRYNVNRVQPVSSLLPD